MTLNATKICDIIILRSKGGHKDFPPFIVYSAAEKAVTAE